MLTKRFFYAILAGLLATNVRPSQKWANLKNSNDNDAGHFGVLVFLIVYILIIELIIKSDRTKAGRYNARARSLQKLSLRRRHEFLSSRGIVAAIASFFSESINIYSYAPVLVLQSIPQNTVEHSE